MYSKRILIVVGLFILVGGGLFVLTKRRPVSEKPVTMPPISATPTPVALLTWTDEAGFSFQYPEGTAIDKHPEDTKNYANLTLTLPSRTIVNITMSDNTYKNLETWVGQNSAVDVTLGGVPAKMIYENDQKTIGCIDNDVFVKIVGDDTTGIVKSWTFIYPTPSTPKNPGTPPVSDENVLEEE